MHNEMGEILLDSQKRVVKRVNKIASPYVASEGMKFSRVSAPLSLFNIRRNLPRTVDPEVLAFRGTG